MTDTKTVKFTNNHRTIKTSLTDEVRELLHKHGLHAWQALQEPLELSDSAFAELDHLISY